MSIETRLNEFKAAAYAPGKLLKKYKEEGKKVIGVLPYYAPEELVYAAGMVPMGIWGTNTKNISKAKEYCATFYCTIAQLALEMMLDGTMDQLDGVITPTICDTLRPMSQNFRVAMAKLEKMPTIFLAHPQYRRPQFGLEFTVAQYTNVRRELEKIAGHEMTPEAISAVNRSAVLKAGYFMEKPEYIEKLNALNEELKALPASEWKGVKIVTSGIICDNPVLLKIFDDNNIAIATDDVAHESRTIRVDAAEEGDPMMALAKQFADEDYDVLLYDEASNQNRRGEFVANLVKESGAQGLVLFMQQFCDPEEMEYPYLKKALDDAGIPHIKLGIDQQMRDFGQASTAIQAFADVLSV